MYLIQYPFYQKMELPNPKHYQISKHLIFPLLTAFVPRLAAFVLLTSHLGAAPPTNLKPATTRGPPLLLHDLD